MSNSLNGLSSEDLERLLKDDPEFAKILLNKKNISGMQGKIIKSNKKNKAPKTKPNNISKPKDDPPKPKPKQDPPKPQSKPKDPPKRIVHKSNDPNKGKELDPKTEQMCTDPKCTICDKPKPQPSNKPNNKPKNISILDQGWLSRIAKLTPKYPKMAHVFDWYSGKKKGVTVLEVKDNIIYYEKLKGKKEK